jgi:phospholipid transport system substrate-binding protein
MEILKLKKIFFLIIIFISINSQTLADRKNLSESDLNEYKSLFKEYFLKSFSSRLSEYTDPKINVLSEEIINEKYTIVFSILEADEKRPEIKIDWRVYTINPQKPLVRDLIIEGLSLARTQREEFNSVIQNGDGNIKILFSNLRKFINS